MTKDETVSLPDEQRQKCEVWTRVMGIFAPLTLSTSAKKPNTPNANAFPKV